MRCPYCTARPTPASRSFQCPAGHLSVDSIPYTWNRRSELLYIAYINLVRLKDIRVKSPRAGNLDFRPGHEVTNTDLNFRLLIPQRFSGCLFEGAFN